MEIALVSLTLRAPDHAVQDIYVLQAPSILTNIIAIQEKQVVLAMKFVEFVHHIITQKKNQTQQRCRAYHVVVSGVLLMLHLRIQNLKSYLGLRVSVVHVECMLL